MLKAKWLFVLLLPVTMALLVLATPAAHTQDASADKNSASSLEGTWQMTSETPNGDSLDWKLTIKQQDGKWTATSGTDQGENPAKDVTVTGNKIHFKTPYQDEDYDIDLTLTGDTLQGTWSGGSDSGKTSGKKASS